MRSAAPTVLIVAGLAAILAPGRARACEPLFLQPHAIDAALVGVDHLPPDLQQPMVAEIGFLEGGGCGSTCGPVTTIRLANLATDDMTPVENIGYRFAVASGTAPGDWHPNSLAFDSGTSGGTFTIYLDGDDSDFDFTLRVIAVDAAGNESPPRTVRIQHGYGFCSVGRPHAGGVTLVIVALALAAALRRPRWRRA